MEAAGVTGLPWKLDAPAAIVCDMPPRCCENSKRAPLRDVEGPARHVIRSLGPSPASHAVSGSNQPLPATWIQPTSPTAASAQLHPASLPAISSAHLHMQEDLLPALLLTGRQAPKPNYRGPRGRQTCLLQHHDLTLPARLLSLAPHDRTLHAAVSSSTTSPPTEMFARDVRLHALVETAAQLRNDLVQKHGRLFFVAAQWPGIVIAISNASLTSLCTQLENRNQQKRSGTLYKSTTTRKTKISCRNLNPLINRSRAAASAHRLIRPFRGFEFSRMLVAWLRLVD
ncbi:hypothetical protein SVAN01_04161 [Stagonosporopsis vannaccii]|nr:hypothetical protein SVAN01_04161 [Stagonosporopsis vannaccii]